MNFSDMTDAKIAFDQSLMIIKKMMEILSKILAALLKKYKKHLKEKFL